MRTLIHLSDLHFGRVDPMIVTPLLDFIRTINPSLVAISGDLTQRARTREFQLARRFLGSIPFPQIVVPGNHDVPLHNLFSRFLRKLDRYRCFISDDLEPFYQDSEIAVLGMNTARSLAWKGGRINRQQLEKLRARFRKVPDSSVKIVVTHHPFDLPKGIIGNYLVGRAQLAMQTIAESRVDLLLAGHFHVGATGYTATHYANQELRTPDCIVRHKHIDARARPAEFTERNSNRRRKDHDLAANMAPETMHL